jgi:predicted transcriptional regulator
LQKKENTKVLSTLIEIVNRLPAKDRLKLLQRIQDEQIPVSIFSSKLSPLESLVFYLKTYGKKDVSQISKLLNRKPSTIYTTLHNAIKKNFSLKVEGALVVPLSLFLKEKCSILEVLVHYLKDHRNMNLREISELLKRSHSTVKTAYWRSGRK